jgi:hypothetical protein
MIKTSYWFPIATVSLGAFAYLFYFMKIQEEPERTLLKTWVDMFKVMFTDFDVLGGLLG